MRKIMVLLFFLFYLPTANAVMHIGSDLTISGRLYSNFQLRTHQFLLLSSRTLGIGIGPAFGYERLYPYLRDSIYGGSIRFGETLFVQLSGGYLKREFNDTKSKGYAGRLAIGYHFGKFFRFSIPIVVKTIRSGIGDNTTSVEVLPYLGLGVLF